MPRIYDIMILLASGTPLHLSSKGELRVKFDAAWGNGSLFKVIRCTCCWLQCWYKKGTPFHFTDRSETQRGELALGRGKRT